MKAKHDQAFALADNNNKKSTVHENRPFSRCRLGSNEVKHYIIT
jgi:hypothetical protein